MTCQSIRERAISENSLVVLLQGLHGQITTVDLRDESTVRGRVINVDAFMNVRLEDVLYRDRRGKVSKMDDLFITGRNVRYVHIPDHMNIVETIQAQLEKIHRVRYFADKAGRKEYILVRSSTSQTTYVSLTCPEETPSLLSLLLTPSSHSSPRLKNKPSG